MAKLALFLLILPIVLAKLNPIIDSTTEKPRDKFENDVWVVDFKNGLDRVTLRKATSEESRIMRNKVGYTDGPREKSRRVKKDDPSISYEMTHDEEKALENQLSIAMNKFMYSIRDDPDTLLSDSGDNGDSYLSIYYTLDATCLTVSTGRQQWHYVVRPAALPTWFYYGNEGIIPRDERLGLFKIIIDFISRLNSHPF